MASAGENCNASQFYITLWDEVTTLMISTLLQKNAGDSWVPLDETVDPEQLEEMSALKKNMLMHLSLRVLETFQMLRSNYQTMSYLFVNSTP
ncbi:hypothetical protein BRADI_2g08650v3 [Brachypodium distachyon]|uniref:Uncharacterized protein n=1 Tax=Brachypodium distachyon TaxID=15368 RepID=I1HDV0_BRADI|nr:hypothetical protein BRADI_2g08650v3 [Brachypodium distachyon]